MPSDTYTTLGRAGWGPARRRPTFLECRNKVLVELRVIIAEAERHGTLSQLRKVGVHFSEAEIRMLIATLVCDPAKGGGRRNQCEGQG